MSDEIQIDSRSYIISYFELLASVGQSRPSIEITLEPSDEDGRAIDVSIPPSGQDELFDLLSGKLQLAGGVDIDEMTAEQALLIGFLMGVPNE